MEETHGDDLEWFFHQWIYEPGYPVFDTSTEWTAGGGNGGTLTLRVEQVQKAEWPAFRMPVELLVVQDGVESRHRVSVAGRVTEATLRLPGASEPSRVVLDPDGWVLKGVR